MQDENLSLFDRQATVPFEDKILTVKDLTRMAKEILEQRFPSVIVEGEISNFKRHMPSGHLYFTLKDDEAQVRVVMWRSDAVRLKFSISDGMKVLVRGRVSLYESRGDFQLYAVNITPAGQGALQLAFEQLKRKLEEEGLFSDEHKKHIPLFPKRIGVVTSLEGAAVRDIASIIERRFPAVEVVIYPVKVQGEGAAEEIACAIDDFNSRPNVDVLIVGRGGGSLEDLWAFNEEIVARSIFNSEIPVISAVGHQVDFTIADFVADVRAATPSAAAELVVPDRTEVLDGLRTLVGKMSTSVGRTTDQLALQLDKLKHHYALRQPISLVEQRLQFVDDLFRRIQTSAEHYIESQDQKMKSIYSHLNALSPSGILRRGYAFVESAGKVVTSARNVEVGQKASIHLHDGILDTQITGKHGQEQ